LDECHFQQHGTRARMWVPPEIKDPVLWHAPTRKSVACFGAVQYRSGKLVTAMNPKFDAVSFEAFLRCLLRHRGCGKRMVIVLDNAKYHHARRLASFLRQHRRVLRLLFLPPYSPQLNPIERVWKLTRRLATHNRYFATLGDLLSAVQERFALWRTANRQLAKLCGII
jgi:transposase